jgi:hypothetical protein
MSFPPLPGRARVGTSRVPLNGLGSVLSTFDGLVRPIHSVDGRPVGARRPRFDAKTTTDGLCPSAEVHPDLQNYS